MTRAIVRGCLLGTFLTCALPAAALAQSGSAARVDNLSGALLQRLPGQKWQPLASGATVPNGALVLALPQAELVSPNGAVQVYLLADVGKRSPYPVMETALT